MTINCCNWIAAIIQAVHRWPGQEDTIVPGCSIRVATTHWNTTNHCHLASSYCLNRTRAPAAAPFKSRLIALERPVYWFTRPRYQPSQLLCSATVGFHSTCIVRQTFSHTTCAAQFGNNSLAVVPAAVNRHAPHVFMTRLTRLVACWGNGQFGRLGNGTQSSELFPRVIPQLLGALAVSAGGAHTAAVTGQVNAAWGKHTAAGAAKVSLASLAARPDHTR